MSELVKKPRKWAAWGSNIMVKVATHRRVIALAPGIEDPDCEPIGEVVSVGNGVPHAEEIICQTVRFNATMIVNQNGHAENDEFVFMTMPHVAIQEMLVENTDAG